MNKQQWFLISAGIILLAFLFLFGNTIPPHKPLPVAAADSSSTVTTDGLIAKYKSGLNDQQLRKLAQLENSVVRGDVKNQQIHVFHQLASYWADTLHKDYLGAYYDGKAAELENSEKNLTFAARLLLEGLLGEQDAAMQHWLATEAKQFFEKALTINPDNDSSKIGLGACYMFGNISNNPMQGILAIREIADKHPDNMYAQMMLGLGGIQSGQYEKAIERFLTVVEKQPENIEAMLDLAQTYERVGDKVNAAKWYNTSLKYIPASNARTEIESKIKSLQ